MGICWKTFQYKIYREMYLFCLHYAYYRDFCFHFWQHEHKLIKWYANRSDCHKSFKLKLFEAKSNLFAEAGLTLKCFALWAAQSDCIKPICVCVQQQTGFTRKCLEDGRKGKPGIRRCSFPECCRTVEPLLVYCVMLASLLSSTLFADAAVRFIWRRDCIVHSWH